MRFLRFSFFSSIPLSYSSAPSSVPGVLGAELGAPHPFMPNFGRLLSDVFHPRRADMPGVTGDGVDDTVYSLGIGGPDIGGEPAREPAGECESR